MQWYDYFPAHIKTNHFLSELKNKYNFTLSEHTFIGSLVAVTKPINYGPSISLVVALIGRMSVIQN
jgi:hypothetical protein